MSQPSPAIVAQSGVSRLPRPALLLLCLAYVLPGFVARAPWKNGDIASFGYMLELAQGKADWLNPLLLGQPPEIQALLPYWLGAWAIQWAPAWMDPDFAARLPFMALLGLTLAATWYAVYYLARAPRAQPVSFAFGGEARPADYACAVADGALLALLACLGLTQLGHETTPALAQLACSTLSFFGLAAMHHRARLGRSVLALGMAGMALSGAPALALLYGLGAIALQLFHAPGDAPELRRRNGLWILAISVATAALAAALGLWRWRIVWPHAQWLEVSKILRFWLWFAWPAWPLALWTLWRWRHRWQDRHLALPLWLTLLGYAASVTSGGDRALLLALPAVATLAAFALPTLSRNLSAFLDWFTMLFFSASAAFIWLYWVSLQTGVPPQPAANVARLAPGFISHFSGWVLGVALAGTVAWLWLLRWRTGRHRPAIWKSLVLPASGTALGWLLLMSLWLPALNFARSYEPLVQKVSLLIGNPTCVEEFGLTRAQVTAFQYHGQFDLQLAGGARQCPWLVVDAGAEADMAHHLDRSRWVLMHRIRRPADSNEDLLLLRRLSKP